MLLNILFLIIGFVLLIKGADIFVDGSSSIAKILKIPSIVVGLTVVSMGTSLPELSVSVNAALIGENSIAVSNVVGSNLFNLLVVLGVCSMIKPITVNQSINKRDFPISIFAAAILLVFSIDTLIKGGSITAADFFKFSSGEKQAGTLGHLDGIILLIIFVIFIASLVMSALKARNAGNEENDDTEIMSPAKSIVYIVLGIIGIIVGGNVVVDNAKEIAVTLGMSSTLVGLTIVAIGTSLPELVTSVVASTKGENDIAVGNVVGSNIFNIFFILGVSGAISPIAITLNSVIDTILLIIVSIMTYIFCITKKELKRVEGAAMVIIYAIFMVYFIIR